MTCKIRSIFGLLRFFFPLRSHDTYYWLKQTELTLFPISFLKLLFLKKIGTVHFRVSINAYLRYECFFQKLICLLATNLSGAHKGPGYLVISEEYILKILSDLSNLETSTFLTFPNQSEQNFHVHRVCFQWLKPKAMLF